MLSPTWSNTLSIHESPGIGRKPVDEVITSDDLAILAPFWTTKPETASRVRQDLETIFDWIIFQGWRVDTRQARAFCGSCPGYLGSRFTTAPYFAPKFQKPWDR